eukprot:3763451-Amphidinium_carterae.2
MSIYALLHFSFMCLPGKPCCPYPMCQSRQHPCLEAEPGPGHSLQTEQLALKEVRTPECKVQEKANNTLEGYYSTISSAP